MQVLLLLKILMRFKRLSMFKNLIKEKFLLLLFLFAFVMNVSYAKSDEKLNANSLDTIRVKVQETEENLKKLDIEIEKLNNEVFASDNELSKIKSEKEKITKLREQNELELKSLEVSIQNLRKDALLLIQRSKGRLRALYRERPVQDLLSFLFSDNNNNGSRIAFYVTKIRNYDKKLMVELITIRRDYAKKAGRQKRILADNIKLEDQLIYEHKKEALQNANKKKMLASLTKKESQVEKELDKLRAQALRIEIVLASVTNGEELFLKDQKEDKKIKKTKKARETKPFDGKGLLALRGKLPAPVKGKIVKTFGRHQVKKFKDFVISKGVEFSVSNGTLAYAVAKGKVIYDGKMPGYGNMIILDHGQRYYTLYSHLTNIDAGVGDVLETGDLVGECEPGVNGTNFYFEIRKDGKPIDPKLYLNKKELI